MLNDIAIGKYVNSNSKIHNMNANAKMISLILFLILSLLARDLTISIVIFLVSIIMVLFTNISIKYYLKFIYQLKFLLLFIFILNFFTSDFQSTAIVFLRLISLLLYTTVVTHTTRPNELNKALSFVLKPLKLFKVPTNKLSSLITISIKFIPVVLSQASKVLKAQISRGLKVRNLKEKILMSKNFVMPLIIHSLRKAEDLGVAMELRLYDYDSNGKSSFGKVNFFDIYIIGMHVCMICAIVILGVIL